MTSRRTIGLILLLAMLIMPGVNIAAGKQGPLYGPYAIAGLDNNQYWFRLVGGTTVYVSAVGLPNSDLDLYIYDGNGRLAAKDVDATSICVLAIDVIRSGEFLIEVRNVGFRANEYILEVR